MNQASFQEVQSRYADVPGMEGIALRRKNYAPFFLRLGHEVVIEEGCRFYHPSRIVLDDDVRINLRALFYGSGGIWIGRHARVGPRVFIHSANHDTSDGPTAFHERGYHYSPVRIGDNTLISADAKILPGADIGDGSFVACGAVVSRGSYDPQSHLFGVPAHNKKMGSAKPRISPSPEIALIVPSSGHWRDLACHILTVLGLPQVLVIEEQSTLPPSVHSTIALGPSDWRPSASAGVEQWRLVVGRAENSDSIVFEGLDGMRVALPNEHTFSVVADGRNENADGLGPLQQTMFWLRERLNKGTGPLSEIEYRDWRVALRILDLQPGRSDNLLQSIKSDMRRRRQVTANGSSCQKPAQKKPASKDPVQIVLEALESHDKGSDLQHAPLKKALSNPRNGRHLVALGITAHLLGDDDSLEQVRACLDSPDWCVPDVAMPRSTANGTGFCYSPLVAAWFFLEARSENPKFALPDRIGGTSETARHLVWKRLENGGLIDNKIRAISRSLLENWVLLHQAPCPPGTQIKLEQHSYRPQITHLEQVWLDIFRSIQFRNNRILIRLHPWPADYRAALSLRYDVDRPVTVQRITEIVETQAKFGNGSCATWYYFADDANCARQAPLLQRHWQELGVHVQRATEAIAGRGVTHHSAPTSDYWRGDESNASIEAAGASHCEFLSTQTLLPRPAWITNGKKESVAGNVWTTPLHFPLEGSTSDTDLAYFDRLLCEFREVLAQGGHAIVGGHPDLGLDLVKTLLRRENLSNVWFASIGQVVGRCQSVLGYGQIATVAVEGAEGLHLLAQSHVADLAVEVWKPGADRPSTYKLQLLAKHPRSMSEILAPPEADIVHPYGNSEPKEP